MVSGGGRGGVGAWLVVENCTVDASMIRTCRACRSSWRGVRSFSRGWWCRVCVGVRVVFFRDLVFVAFVLLSSRLRLRAGCGVVVVWVCQVFKGAWWMPWHQEPMKDVGACDKPRGVGNRMLIRGCPNGGTRPSSWAVTRT